MSLHSFEKRQNLNKYAEMLQSIYGPTQNYAKPRSEIYAHLAEVCGITGKHLFKKNDLATARRFLPKIFGWAVALVNAVSPHQTTLEDMILRKFPQACPYCLESPCDCWSGNKPAVREEILERLYYNKAATQARGVNDFELMFGAIYSHTWRGKSSADDEPTYVFLRMIEELAEVGEALRFHHIYPENLENELADFFAWWFALSSVLRRQVDGDTLDDLLWGSYPGQCKDCESAPCFCAQGPVRELMSKPAPGRIRETDGLTGLRNQTAYKEDLGSITSGKLVLACPMACVRLDVDKFKSVNDTYGHDAGDAALAHIARILRQKARPRDRIYRISGDEFGILMPDATEEEAFGAMRRVISALGEQPLPWGNEQTAKPAIVLSVSVGVAECSQPDSIQNAFSQADAASYVSKNGGGGVVTRASQIEVSSDH